MKPMHIKIIAAVIFCCVFFCVLLYFISPDKAKADSFSLYATECDGAFENSENATGSPDVKDKKVSSFNNENSAILIRGVQGELHCRNFKGGIVEDAIPKKITARFSWVATYDEKINEPEKTEPTIDTGPAQIIESSSSSIVLTDFNSSSTESSSTQNINSDSPVNIENNSTTTDLDISNIQPELPKVDTILEKVEIIETEEVSDKLPEVSTNYFLNYFIKTAFAEVATETIEILENTQNVTTTVENLEVKDVATSSEVVILVEESSTANTITTTTTTSTVNEISDAEASSTLVQENNIEEINKINNENEPHGILEVLYSPDGKELKRLGFVEIEEMDEISFEIPLPEEVTWKKIEEMQIFVRSVPTIDNVAPLIYVDSIWLDVEYDAINIESKPFPSEDRGDVFIGNVTYGNYTAFLVNRPLLHSSSTATSSIDNSNIASSSKMKTEIWISDDLASSTNRWTYVTGGETINPETKVFYRFGRLFWIDSANTLWSFNLGAQAFDTMSIEKETPTQFTFDDESGQKKVLIITQPDNVVAFEDYIPPKIEE